MKTRDINERVSVFGSVSLAEPGKNIFCTFVILLGMENEQKL